MPLPSRDEVDLLNRWEETYKKGLLSFWILLALHERPVYPFEMNTLITQLSQGSLSVEDNSIYRALYRFEQLGIVSSEKHVNVAGPDRRYYSLTRRGLFLLQNFIKRNLLVFQSGDVPIKIKSVLDSGDIPNFEKIVHQSKEVK
jgi:PadR family transcriptional regulator, regulatory protein PadR